MEITKPLRLFAVGLVLVVSFAEELVKGVVSTSLGVGVVSSWEGGRGIALGSVMGAALVAVALAFRITALLVPIRFQQVPRQVLLVPFLAVLPAGALGARWRNLLVGWSVAARRLYPVDPL